MHSFLKSICNYVSFRGILAMVLVIGSWFFYHVHPAFGMVICAALATVAVIWFFIQELGE